MVEFISYLLMYLLSLIHSVFIFLVWLEFCGFGVCCLCAFTITDGLW